MLQLRLVCCYFLQNKGGKAVVLPHGAGRGCKGLKPQQHTLSPLDR